MGVSHYLVVVDPGVPLAVHLQLFEADSMGQQMRLPTQRKASQSSSAEAGYPGVRDEDAARVRVLTGQLVAALQVLRRRIKQSTN